MCLARLGMASNDARVVACTQLCGIAGRGSIANPNTSTTVINNISDDTKQQQHLQHTTPSTPKHRGATQPAEAPLSAPNALARKSTAQPENTL